MYLHYWKNIREINKLVNKRLCFKAQGEVKEIADQIQKLIADKMDKRLKFIESCVDRNTYFRYRVLGVAGIIGAIAGGAISVMWNKVSGKE